MAAIVPGGNPLADAIQGAGLAPGMYIVHNHPPGTPCRPLSHTEIQQAAQRRSNIP